MKKLLVLLVILGIASFASAFTMTIGHNTENTLFSIDMISGMAGNTTAIPMTGDGSGTYWVLIGVAPTSGALASTLPVVMGLSAVYGDAGQTGIFKYGIGVVGEFRTPTMGSWSAAAGTWADGFTAINNWNVYLFTINDAVTEATWIPQWLDQEPPPPDIFVPEPTTITLLCLGGLMLRRKK
jgi:hypothetical protein